VEDRREDPRFDAWMNALEAALRDTPAPRAGRGAGRRL
jgi:hypothetical protein